MHQILQWLQDRSAFELIGGFTSLGIVAWICVAIIEAVQDLFGGNKE